MPVEIRNQPFDKRLYGISKPVMSGQKPGDVMFKAMDEMWGIVRGSQVRNKGINHIFYSGNSLVYAGVELENGGPAPSGLTQRDVHFSRYVYYHLEGPYSLIPTAYQEIHNEIAAQNLTTTGESMEIYGHASADPDKQVTEILVGVQ